MLNKRNEAVNKDREEGRNTKATQEGRGMKEGLLKHKEDEEARGSHWSFHEREALHGATRERERERERESESKEEEHCG